VESPLTARAGAVYGSARAEPAAQRSEFVDRHRHHGQLTADAAEPEADGYTLTVTCPCGVTLMRWVPPIEA
jgi:hypothetical protein